MTTPSTAARPRTTTRRASLVAALATAVAGALAASLPAAPAGAAPGSPGTRDVRVNQVQVIGTHNSYHRELPRDEQALQLQLDEGAGNLFYSHASLPQQFSGQSVRGLELDLFPDPEGGLYEHPLIRRLAGKGPLTDPAWDRPGVKVLHVADFDYATTCVTLVQCLRQVDRWSDANPGHVPIPIMLELKQSSDDLEAAGGVQSPPWDAAQLDALDAEIRSVFDEDEVLTPDDVRRPGLTLRRSVLQHGWPRLDDARGQVMFLMDNEPGELRDTYRAGRPSLAGRVLFTNAEPWAADAAFLKRNEPLEGGAREIARLVRQGFYVRTRSDVPLDTVLEGDTSMRRAALASGAQLVSTDFPAVGMAARYDSDYVAQLPGAASVRCNPVNAPRSCRSGALER